MLSLEGPINNNLLFISIATGILTHLQVSYPARDRYTNAIHPSSVPGVRDGGSSSSNALPGVQRSHQHYSALAEKYRDRVQSQGVVPPNWYYNRGKPVIYDP